MTKSQNNYSTRNKWIGLPRSYYLSVRSFPYAHYLLTMLPFIALIVVDHRLPATLVVLCYVAPFVTAMGAGFLFNTFCDAVGDPAYKNPVTRNELNQFQVYGGLGIALFTSVVLFWIGYAHQVGLVLFIIYLWLWLAYSGLQIRFKETAIAPLIASLLLWAGPSLFLMMRFRLFDPVVWLMWLGILFVFTGHEIKHTRIDRPADIHSGWKTFSVRYGPYWAAMMEYLAIAIGYGLFLLMIYKNHVQLFMFAGLFFLTLIGALTYSRQRQHLITEDTLPVVLPYMIAKLFLVLFMGWTLQLSPLIVLLMAWLYLSM